MFNPVQFYEFGKSKVIDDAQIFINVSGITNPTQISAIRSLVSDLKINGLWTRLKAIYPFVGGTAFTHKWNLKDPRDLNIAFRLINPGGTQTHSSTGVKPSSSSSDTFINPSSVLSPSSGNLTFYSRENLAGGYDMGSSEGNATSKAVILISRYSSNLAYASYGNGGYTGSIASTDSKGMWMTNRNDATNTTLWKNGLKLKTVAETVSLSSINTVRLFATSVGANVSGFSSDKECAYASIGGGFSDSEALTYYNIIQAYQTTLGRQV